MTKSIAEAMPAADALAATLMARLEELAGLSEERGALTRRFATPEHAAASWLIRGWMEQAGMAVHVDDVGNTVGRYPGHEPDAPALIMGSHQDTVRDGGKYDGMLGIVAPLACVRILHDAGLRLPFPIEVVAFCDEEGVRFQSTLLGSRALAGTFDMDVLDRRDDDGITVRRALTDFGCEPDRIPEIARQPGDVLGFVETHIEQGPVLEAEGLPVGVVTAFAGCSRLRVSVAGEAGHAGTVPMERRRDALAAAAAAILLVESLPREAGEDAVATVGRIAASPGAINVIPGHASFTVDLRSPDDRLRESLLARLRERLAALAGERGVRIEVETLYELPACACDDGLRGRLEAAVAAEGYPVRRLFSGAGHDAMAMADLTRVGMIFVRCEGGISHNPREAITGADAATAVRVLFRFLTDLADRR